MRFVFSHTKQYLAAAIVASLLQGVAIATPVFAEAAANNETTVSQEATSGKDGAKAGKSAARPDEAEQVAADHSAESRPVKNAFLKDGTGIPGSEIPPYNNDLPTKEKLAEEKALQKEIKNLQRQREAFLKDRVKEQRIKDEAFAAAFKNRQEFSIDFDPGDYTKRIMNANGETLTFRAYENLVYVRKPYDPESQMLSVYIPEAYFNGGTVNGFTAETAPIFMPNGVGGYMPGKIEEPLEESRHGGANAALYALSNGYVVVSPAIRGRSLKHKNGYETGKAPAFIVDYKAAVRFVRHNRKAGRIPAGDTEKIISSGTSAGGALSALLGATGNARDYDPYLKELGAAKERDDIFASMAYCPITNLENADMAYEWMFHNADRYSTELRDNFIEYLNALNLRDSLGNRLNLSANGDGLFREYIESLYLKSAQDAIDTGEDVSKTPWLTVSDNTAVHMDFDKYVATVKRLKGVPAFDAFDLSTGENNEFGTYGITNKHFTRFALEHSKAVKVPSLKEEEEAIRKEKEEAIRDASPIKALRMQKADLEEQLEKDKPDLSQYMADNTIVTMMNPMDYIGRANVQTAPHWRIRHGALDRDTALAVPALLALKLKNSGKSVDFKVAWGYGHAGDYDLPELFAWTDRICKIKDKADAILKEEQKKAKAESKEQE
jgi:acetyl esterase/lipase